MSENVLRETLKRGSSLLSENPLQIFFPKFPLIIIIMSFMEDEDDDFGDLYTDVLLPFNTPSQPPPPQQQQQPPLSSDLSDDDDKKPHVDGGSSNSKLPIPSEALVSDRTEERGNFVITEEEDEVVTRVSPKEDASRVLDFGVSVKSEPFVSSAIGDDNQGAGDAGGEVKMERMDMDEQPMIPGLSSSSYPFDPPAAPSEYAEEEAEEPAASKREEDEWDSDSDSEDDLKIVLNEDEHDGMNGKENEGEGDNEDGQGLGIGAGDDQIHQLGEEQELGEDGTKQMGDGSERKEIGEAKGVNGGVMMMPNSGGVRPMYTNQGFHPHHSQFKYVRPGAAMVPGGANVGPGGLQNQVRPLVNMGAVPGTGRGDWRPMGVKGVPPMQKGFQPGFGFPGQRGPEFTLPSHKTVFDIDIDGIEEKTWRYPGVDISDFFNFGLNEEAWKDYCKQLVQLRLESTMQSKIRVYESGRQVQDYDPDLPPELVLAAGGQDTGDSLNPGKIDGGQGDLTGQGRGAAHARPMMPPGRAIQVEGGYGERLPSAETRPQRARDTDSVIEIVLQGSVDDDSSTDNGTNEQLGNEVQGEDLKGDHETEEDIAAQPDNESYDRLPYKSTKEMVREDPFMGSGHTNNTHERDGVPPSPSEAVPVHHRPGPKGHNPGVFGASHEGRRPHGDVRDRYSRLNHEDGRSVNLNHAAVGSKSHDTSKGKSSRSSDGNQTPESSSHVQVDGARGSVSENKDDSHNELATEDSSVGIDEDEISRDVTLTNDATDGQDISKVDQPAVMDVDEAYDLMTTRSSDTSKARSGGSRDYQKKRENGEEEVVQESRPRRMGDIRRRRDEDESNFRKRGSTDRDGRQDVGRNLMAVKVREDSHHPSRESYPNPAHQLHPKTTDFEMRRDSSSAGARQRRDDDMQGRKRERVEEIGSRHGSKARESESNDREEHHHLSRKRLENSEWRGRPEKIVGHSQRDRDEYMMNRHESLNDPPSKRRKDEEYPRREQAEKEEYLHGFRTREGSSRRKREADDFMEHRRDDRLRFREKPDDPHFIRHRDESWRPRERDEWQRLKQPHEDIFPNREREEIRGTVRNSRGLEDKPLMGNARTKDEPRIVGFEKDFPFKDKKRLNEQSKRREREEDATLLQNRGREDVFASENYTHNEDRNPRHERSSKNSDHSVDNRQWSHKERPKEISRSKESELGDQNTVARSKRKQEESSARYVKVGKGASEQESGNVPTESRVPGQSRTVSSSLSKKNHQEHELPLQHNSRNHRQDASSDDERQNSRRRLSKQDNSTSERERTRGTNTKTKETNKKNKNETVSLGSDQPEELVKKTETGDNQHPPNEEKAAGDSERNGDDRGHLDTVAKLKKRSERFKLPLTSERDATGNRKADAEVVTAHNETAADEAGIKPERPARKRRWTGS